MNQDNFLNYSLAIGFSLVALVYFYEDYSSFIGFGETKKSKVEQFVDSDPGGSDFTVPTTHVVEAGEKVEDIAQNYGLTIEQLFNLNDDIIQEAGTKPNGQKDYVVFPGDELKLR